MKASELRIGNLVYVHRGTHKVTTTITDVTLSGLTEEYELPDVHFAPITLTEKWLKKLGFKKLGGMLALTIGRRMDLGYPDVYEWQIICDPDGQQFSLFIKGLGTAGFLHIKHVHQLQNLYFAVSGEELIIS